MAARPRNIQLFDHITAVVLARLYEAFPTPVDLRPIDIGGEVAAQVEAEGQEAFDMGGLVRHTITFLEQENLVNVGYVDEDLGGVHGFRDVRLTGPGMTVLGQDATPLALIDAEGRQSWGIRLRSALANPEMLAATVRAILNLAG